MKKYLLILILLPILAFAQSGDSTVSGSSPQYTEIIPPPPPVTIILPRPTINLGPPTWFYTSCGFPGGTCQCPDGWIMTGTSGWWATYTNSAFLCRKIL